MDLQLINTVLCGKVLVYPMCLILWNIKYKQVSYIIVHANIFIHGGGMNTV